jgi:hypothetical protein
MAYDVKWDVVGERTYETGVDRGVLYPRNSATNTYPEGVAWNGLTTVTESPSGAESTPIYADNIQYFNLFSDEKLGGTIEAFTYPDEFAACDGSAQPTPGLMLGQQTRQMFSLAYRTVYGNDSLGQTYGYKLHLIYNAKASPSERAHATINDTPEAMPFSWAFTTTPITVEDYKALSSITIDSTKVDKDLLAALETILYGTEEVVAPGTPAPAVKGRLPFPAEIITLLTPKEH